MIFSSVSLPFILLGGALAGRSADAELEAAFKDPSIVKLTPSTFPDFIKSEVPVLVEFYANWCGHCKTLAPEYAKAAGSEELKKKGVKLASIDCTEHGDFCGTHVSGFPTLFVYKKGERTAYEGGRKTKAIIDYMLM